MRLWILAAGKHVGRWLNWMDGMAKKLSKLGHGEATVGTPTKLMGEVSTALSKVTQSSKTSSSKKLVHSIGPKPGFFVDS